MIEVEVLQSPEHSREQVPGEYDSICWCWDGPVICWLAVFGFTIKNLKEQVPDPKATIVLAQHVRTTKRFYDHENSLDRTDIREIAEIFPLYGGGGGEDSHLHPDNHYDSCAPPDYRIHCSVAATVRVAKTTNRVMSREEIREGGKYVYYKLRDPATGQVVPLRREQNRPLYDRCLNMGGTYTDKDVELEFLMDYGQLIYSYEADAHHFPPPNVTGADRKTWFPRGSPPDIPPDREVSKLLDAEDPGRLMFPDGLDRVVTPDGGNTPRNHMDDQSTWGGRVQRSSASGVFHRPTIRPRSEAGEAFRAALGQPGVIVKPTGLPWTRVSRPQPETRESDPSPEAGTGPGVER